MYSLSERLSTRLVPECTVDRCTHRKAPRPKPKPRTSIAHLYRDFENTSDIDHPEPGDSSGVLICQRSFDAFKKEYNVSATACGVSPCPADADIREFCRVYAPGLLHKPLYLFGNPHPNFRGKLTDMDELQDVVPGAPHRLANQYILVCTTDAGGQPGVIVYFGVVCGSARINSRVKVHAADYKNDLVFVVRPLTCIGLPWHAISPGGDHDDLFRWNTMQHAIPKSALRVFARAPGLVAVLSRNLRESRDVLRAARDAGTLNDILDTKPFKETRHLRIALLLDLVLPIDIVVVERTVWKFNV